jgi:hypothetical protein
MKTIIYFLLVFLLCNCQEKKDISIIDEKINNKISKEDSLFVESELLKYKNCLFSEIYQLGINNTYKKLGYEQKIKPKDLTYYFYGGDFNPEFMKNDTNRSKLITKWLNDKTYESVPEIVDGSLDIVRALDFYNSEDLKQYLDSLRVIEYERINENL